MRPPRIETHLCETQGCVLLAKALGKRLNDNPHCRDLFGVGCTDICQDFFGGVCGVKNATENKIFPGEDFLEEASRLDEIEEVIFMRKLLALREPDPLENMTDSDIQMSRFFVSCLERDESTADARDFFLKLLSDIGIPMGFSALKQSLSMFSALVRLSLVWGINNPLLFIELRPMRATKHYVTVMVNGSATKLEGLASGSKTLESTKEPQDM